MEVEHADDSCCRLETDPKFSGGYPADVVTSFRKKLAFLRHAMDERDIYAMKGFRFEKLKGARAHQRSIRLNDQWRLILEFSEGAGEKTVKVIGIEDYH